MLCGTENEDAIWDTNKGRGVLVHIYMCVCVLSIHTHVLYFYNPSLGFCSVINSVCGRDEEKSRKLYY